MAVLCIVGPGHTGPDWVMEQTKERLRRELEADEREYEEQLKKARKREAAAKKAALARVRKKPVSLLLFVPCELWIEDERQRQVHDTEEVDEDDVYLPEESHDSELPSFLARTSSR